VLSVVVAESKTAVGALFITKLTLTWLFDVPPLPSLILYSIIATPTNPAGGVYSNCSSTILTSPKSAVAPLKVSVSPSRSVSFFNHQ
jgi:hypothetical protein